MTYTYLFNIYLSDVNTFSMIDNGIYAVAELNC